MATCIDCGKKIRRFFSRSNIVEGKFICGKCDDKRREKEKMEDKETKRLDSERERTTGNGKPQNDGLMCWDCERRRAEKRKA